jgi:uncharacterized protein (TIGR02646 family)
VKYIKKGKEPQEFYEWKLLNQDLSLTYKELPSDVKQAVYNALRRDQGNICCYCERALLDHDFHIEHLNPQSNRVGDDLNYDNFLCSCLNQITKGTPRHCGLLKGHATIEVHPLLQDCHLKFNFTGLGEIVVLDDEANKTIKTLGLDIKKLNDMRKDALMPFLDENLSPEEFMNFFKQYVMESASGALNPFYSMIKCLFFR